MVLSKSSNPTTNQEMKTKIIIIGIFSLLFIVAFYPWHETTPTINAPIASAPDETPMPAEAPAQTAQTNGLALEPDGSIVVHERASFALAPVGSKPPTNVMTQADFRKLYRRNQTNNGGMSVGQ